MIGLDIRIGVPVTARVGVLFWALGVGLGVWGRVGADEGVFGVGVPVREGPFDVGVPVGDGAPGTEVADTLVGAAVLVTGAVATGVAVVTVLTTGADVGAGVAARVLFGAAVGADVTAVPACFGTGVVASACCVCSVRLAATTVVTMRFRKGPFIPDSHSLRV